MMHSDFWRNLRLAFTSRGPYDPTGRDQEIARLRKQIADHDKRWHVMASGLPRDTDEEKAAELLGAIAHVHNYIYGSRETLRALMRHHRAAPHCLAGIHVWCVEYMPDGSGCRCSCHGSVAELRREQVAVAVDVPVNLSPDDGGQPHADRVRLASSFRDGDCLSSLPLVDDRRHLRSLALVAAHTPQRRYRLPLGAKETGQ